MAAQEEAEHAPPSASSPAHTSAATVDTDRNRPQTPAFAGPVREGPRLRVLGIAQDAGVPQLGCRCARCERARKDTASARYVASVGFTDGRGRVYLVDATPDLRAQVALVRDWLDEARQVAARVRRPVDGIFLTHGHMGHYAGLLQLGFEAAHTDAVPVYGTGPMLELLRRNAPWRQLLDKGELDPREVVSGTAVSLGEISVTPVAVPHRAEFTDTVGVKIDGPKRAVLYLPDVARWAEVADMDALLRGVDVLLLDGTFYSGDELPGRDLSAIGHPLVVDSVERLTPQVRAGALRVIFVHLNHSNPLHDPDSAASRAVAAAGFEVATRGLEIAL